MSLAALVQDAFANQLVRQVFWAVALLIATSLIARVASRATSRLLHHDSNPLPTSSIIINIVRAIIWIVGGCIVLDSVFGINTSSFIAALGVGGIAVSLGFQDTLSNLIGGLQVTFMRIVTPGDNIEVGTQRGVVQDVSWRHTTIRDNMGQTVIIPNSIISKTALVHLLPANRVSVPFNVARVHPAAVESGAGEGAGSASSPNPATDLGAEATIDLDALSAQIVEHARVAVEEITPITEGPRVHFSEIGELGIKGSVILLIEDATKTSAATDAVVRAVTAVLG